MVRLHLLGELRLEIDGQDAPLPVSRKARLLLAMLALERRAHGRSELAGRLWPDVREDSARASLRNALAQLRGALGEHADRVVRIEGGEALALALGVNSDVELVDRLLVDGHAEAAADACEAQLLPGFDDEWTCVQRDALGARLAAGLAAAGTAAEAAGDLASAVRLTRRLTELDRLAEIAHRDLMRRLAAHGDRAAALAVYERLRERLADELGIAPSSATRALVASIRTDGGATAPAARVGPSAVRYARNGGHSIAYQRFGGGTPDVLIVPGWASNLDAVWGFPPLGPLFARLGEIARCTVFDKRGTGLSDRDGDFGSLEARADDIRAVMDAAGIERSTLFAYSESAALALVFAAVHPERVEALILYSSYARLIQEPGYHGFEREVVDSFLAQIRSDWGTGAVSRISFQGAPDTAAVRDLLARWERSVCTPTMAAHIIRANTQIDVRPLLSSVRARTLVLHSTGDPIAPPALGRFVASQLPNATYLEHEADYHLPWEGGTAWFLDEAARFLTAAGASDKRAEPLLATVLVAADGALDAAAVTRYGGQLTDAATALFSSPSPALDCAATLAAPLGTGVHTGELMPDEGGGAAVEIARNVAALAAPGEVLVSRTVRDLTAGSARRFEERGRHAFAALTPSEWDVFRYLR
jgi:DNA-binding SARP family transcriptional activator/pimeloyl-ACP methyl ester carboxylesterase